MSLIKHSVIVLLLAASPQGAFAAIQITEIMYDVSGTDTGREWVEVTNTGSGAVDISGFKFFEANTNHALTLVSGSGVLQPNASAVIADDSDKFKIDWPTFGGTLLSSSFSLSNTGETLVIKDGTLSVHDSVTYDSGSGAAGDGSSLQRQGSTFTAASPTPGSYSAPAGTADSDTPVSNSSTSTTAAPALGTTVPAPISLRIQADDTVMVGGGSFFEAQVFGTQGLPLPARVAWNFGDGAVAEGARVFHAYAYPGKYVVAATASYNFSATSQYTTVEAVGALVTLRAEGDGSLVVVNQSKKDLHVGLWSLVRGVQRFVIPDGTVVLAGEGVRFAPTVIGFTGDLSAALRYPNDAVAAVAGAGATSPLRGERVPAPAPATGNASRIDAAETIDQRAPAQPAADASQSAAVAQTGEQSWLPVAGLVAVLGAGAAGAYFVRPRRPETSDPAEEFEIE